MDFLDPKEKTPFAKQDAHAMIDILLADETTEKKN